jgi:hypothetical protein
MAVLVDQQNALTAGRTRPLNLAEGGQNGAMMAPHQWVSSAGYMKQKVIAVLLSAPVAMRYMDSFQSNLASLKALIEVMPLSIDGLNSTLEWEFNETPVGNAGEMFETVTKGNRQRSTPSFRWSEKYGSSIQRFWTEYGRLLLQDPDLGVPGIVSAPGYLAAGSPAILPDHQAMTVLFIEPDETLTNVTHAWLCTNMMPKSGGEITGKREIGAANDVPEVNIDFTALTMTGRAVVEQAKAYLQSLNLANLRPTELRPFIEGATPDVASAQSGFRNKIDESVRNL